MWKWLKNLIGLLICSLLLLWTIRSADSLTTKVIATANASKGTGILEKIVIEFSAWDAKGIMNVGLAGIVGVLGAIAFYYGVYIGFIGRETRTETLRYLSGQIGERLHYIGMFFLLGGVVAGVFQAAQHETFAPIQAFVLGATWPSVVTQIMSGQATKAESAKKLADISPANIPAVTPNKSAADAEVVI